jgi:SAM-dependent methyltransferase
VEKAKLTIRLVQGARHVSEPQRLPPARAVNRIDFLCSLASGKRVIHVGFCDSDSRGSYEPSGIWLHSRLAGLSASLVGIDLDVEGVERCGAEGYEAYVADCRDLDAIRDLGLAPADVVIAGEVIEHTDGPGDFLEGMHLLLAPRGTLAITTPNAYSILQPIAALRSYELVNRDHVAIYSWYTLSNVMRRHGWNVREVLAYHQPLLRGRSPSIEVAAGRMLARLQRLASRRWPFIDYGLIALAEHDASSFDGLDG